MNKKLAFQKIIISEKDDDCLWCAENIKKGVICYRLGIKSNKRFFTEKMHTECFSAFFYSKGRDLDFIFGSFLRGLTPLESHEENFDKRENEYD